MRQQKSASSTYRTPPPISSGRPNKPETAAEPLAVSTVAPAQSNGVVQSKARTLSADTDLDAADEEDDDDDDEDMGDDDILMVESDGIKDKTVQHIPMGQMMSPPPEGGSFDSLEAVQKSVLAYCTSVGYAVVIGRSKKTVPGLKKVLFVCDRSGKPPTRIQPESRKRKTSSRKCNCPFGFFAIEQRTQWTIRYRPDRQHLTHNHGPSESPSIHPAARKLDRKMIAQVKAHKETGELKGHVLIIVCRMRSKY